jgi:hypothetical protein
LTFLFFCSLPPKRFPLIGNLSSKLSSEVRASITNAAIQKQISTEAKLAECEKQNKKLTVAAEAVRELRADGDGRLEQVMAMMRKLNGDVLDTVSDEQEEEKKEKIKVGGSVTTPPSIEKPLRAATHSSPAPAGRGKPDPSRRPLLSRATISKPEKGKTKAGAKLLGIRK